MNIKNYVFSIALTAIMLILPFSAHADWNQFWGRQGDKAYDYVHAPNRFTPQTQQRIDNGVSTALPFVDRARQAPIGCIAGLPRGAAGCVAGAITGGIARPLNAW